MDIIPKKSKMDKDFPVDTHGSRINRKQDFLKIEWPSHRSYYGIPPEAESYRSAHHTFYIVNCLSLVSKLPSIEEAPYELIALMGKNSDRANKYHYTRLFYSTMQFAHAGKYEKMKEEGINPDPYDGKYILDGERMIICQSNAATADLKAEFPGAEINPLGDWTGGTEVDSGATNRKLGSDMADSVTGGGLHGKDLSKADVSVNIHAFLKAQRTGDSISLCCAIGDETVDGLPYADVVEEARQYVAAAGGFEKFAEWGLF